MNELLPKALSEIRSSLRFRWYGMALAWLLCVTGWVVVAWLPNVYEARARVFVDTSSVLQPVLGDQIVTPDVDAQLAFVRVNLLGAERLAMVARTVGLDATAFTPREREAVIRRLGEQIRISVEPGSMQGNVPQNNIYTISYRNEERDKAIGVVRTLHDALIEDTLQAQLAGTDKTESFINDNLEALELELQQIDQVIAEFKRANADRLPGTEGDYFTRRQNEMDELADLQYQMRVQEAKRLQINEQLSGEAELVGAGSIAGQELRPDSTEARIRAAQRRVDELLVDFTERSQEVITARQILERLQDERAEELRQLGIEGDDQQLAGLAVNRVREELRIALSETEVEIASLREAIAISQARVDELQSLIDEVPAVEAELARLTRDREVKQGVYTDLARSRERDDLSRQASLTDQVDFSSVDPPDAPLAPVAPARLMLLAAVFVGSIAAGGALCFLLSQVFPVFGSVKQLQDRLSLPVIGLVTQAWEESHLRQQRRAAVAFGAAFTLLTIIFVGVAGFEFAVGIHTLFGGSQL